MLACLPLYILSGRAVIGLEVVFIITRENASNEWKRPKEITIAGNCPCQMRERMRGIEETDIKYTDSQAELPLHLHISRRLGGIRTGSGRVRMCRTVPCMAMTTIRGVIYAIPLFRGVDRGRECIIGPVSWCFAGIWRNVVFRLPARRVAVPRGRAIGSKCRVRAVWHRVAIGRWVNAHTVLLSVNPWVARRNR